MFPKKLLRKLNNHKNAVYSAEFTNDGIYCMTGGQDSKIHLINPEKSLLIKTYHNEHGNELRDLKIRSDNCQFATGGSDKNAYVWDVSNGRILRKIRGHSGTVNAVNYNNDETVLVTGSYDGKVCAWDLRTNSFKPIQTMDDFEDSVSSVKICDQNIICGSIDGNIYTYDIRKGKLTKDQLHSPVTSIAVSNDKNCVLATCLNSKLQLLDKENGALLNTFEGHKNFDFLIKSDFEKNDAFVLTGSENGQICVWNLTGKELLHSLKVQESIVSVVKFNPKFNCFVSADVSGNVFYWGE